MLVSTIRWVCMLFRCCSRYLPPPMRLYFHRC